MGARAPTVHLDGDGAPGAARPGQRDVDDVHPAQDLRRARYTRHWIQAEPFASPHVPGPFHPIQRDVGDAIPAQDPWRTRNEAAERSRTRQKCVRRDSLRIRRQRAPTQDLLRRGDNTSRAAGLRRLEKPGQGLAARAKSLIPCSGRECILAGGRPAAIVSGHTVPSQYAEAGEA